MRTGRADRTVKRRERRAGGDSFFHLFRENLLGAEGYDFVAGLERGDEPTVSQRGFEMYLGAAKFFGGGLNVDPGGAVVADDCVAREGDAGLLFTGNGNKAGDGGVWNKVRRVGGGEEQEGLALKLGIGG